jgi:HB1, ASXL, restriction endonuclease HTH domain
MSKETKPNMQWEDAIKRVLSEADGALHYAEVAERIASKGLRQSLGATPAATVSSYLSTSLRELGDESPYLRVGRGIYALKAAAEKQAQDETTADKDAVQQEAGALRAFGMFWKRDSVYWLGKAQLLGKQGTGATDVNFANQIGVYLLHDRDRVIYVGRAADTLFARLKAHTTDRLGGRWDRFSWFGLRSVLDDGQLSDGELPWGQSVVIETMEAVLIESLEPALNRRRGDNFSGAEYIQAPDPQIERIRNKALLEKITKHLDAE